MSHSPTPVGEFLNSVTITNTSSGVDYIDCIYVINLDERTERWENFFKKFSYYNIAPNRVSAVNGWKISDKDRNRFVTPGRLNGGQVGCLLSHLSIYRDALLRKFDVVWICEDDLEPEENILTVSSLLQELSEMDPGWDILYTDFTVKGRGEQANRPNQPLYKVVNQSLSKRLQKIHGRHGTHSIIYSKSGLRKAAKYFFHVYFFSPIDLDIHYVPDFREYSVRESITKLAGFSTDTEPHSSLNK